MTYKLGTHWVRLTMTAACIALTLPAVAQDAMMPVVTDSRIKTLVYNENDVYNILTHYGYQSNVEFAQNESVQTVSVGDRVSWQIVPAGRRLFIKALEENAHTNMTVVTNKRAYQFDLRASGKEPLHPSEELVYVVRFFYPDEQRPAATGAYAPAALPATATTISAPAPVVTAPDSAALNYNYTYSGSEWLAPLKIYDDGIATYFALPNYVKDVQIMRQSPTGMEAVSAAKQDNGEYKVQGIAPQFRLVNGTQAVDVFNETQQRAEAM